MNISLALRRVGPVTILALAGACASGQQTESPFDGGRDTTQVTIEVLNLNWSDATLWAWRGGDRVRLGIVAGKREGTFSLRWDFSLPLQIEIDLLAGDRCITQPLGTDPGDIIELQIPIDIRSEPDCTRRR